MKTAKIVINFTTLSDGNLESKALSIIDAMTDNPNFPNPDPSLAEVNTAVTEYSSALAGARSKDKVQVELKNIKRAALITVLKNLAAYVNYTSKGDRSIMASSGFDVSKDAKSAIVMSAPKNFKIVSGENSGQAFLKVSGVKGIKTYAHQYTPDPLTDASVWQTKYVTTRYYTFEGLETAKKYWFRVAAIGSGDQIMYTDPIAMVIQ